MSEPIFFNRNSTRKKKETPRGKHHNKTATKTTVSLYLSKRAVEKAREYKLNISRITEQALISIIDYLETQNQTSSKFLGEASFLKKVLWSRGWELNPFIAALQAAA